MLKHTLGLVTANYTSDFFGVLTDKRTAATLPCGGRYRLIDFVLSNMVNSGISTVGVIAPTYFRSLLDHAEAGKPWGLAKKSGGMFIMPGTLYGEHSKKVRFLLRDFILNKRIIEKKDHKYILFADSSKIMNINYEEFVKAHEASGCRISFMYKKETGREGNVYLITDENGIVTDYQTGGGSDKIFLDCMVIDREYFLDFMKWYESMKNMDILEIFMKYKDQFRINTYEMHGYAAIIDNLADYKKANMDLLNSEVREELFNNPDRRIYTKVQDEPPTVYRKGADVKNSLIGAGSVIEGSVENSIIFRNGTVKAGAVVKDSIIMQHGIILEGALVENAILDKNVTISAGAKLQGGLSGPALIAKNQTL